MTNKKSTSSLTPKLMLLLKHLGAYIVLLLVAMLYFKPIAFDGMSLRQGDNVQATQLQSEILEYQEKEGTIIRWTNHIFGGMPTALMRGNNSNYVAKSISQGLLFSKGANEWMSLFLIMLCCYIGLILLRVNFTLSIGLAIILGFFTSNTLYIEAGHTGKMNVLATIPMIIGAFIYAYRSKPLLGFTLFAVGLSYNIVRNHVQMTYYMYMALSIIGLFFLIEAISKKDLPKFSKFAGLMIIASVLGIFSNLGTIWPTYEYGQSSTRGTTELTQKKQKTGLDYDYIFGLSMEKMEVATLMFPNFYGGTQQALFLNNPESATTAAFNDPTVRQEINMAAQKANVSDVNNFTQQVATTYTRQYRGSQTMSGGPMYFGIVVCFLFILSLLLLRGAIKWAFLSTFVLFVVLAWGKHFAFFNDLMFNYFPMYSKFRDTKMTLLAAQPIVILAIGMGLMELVNFDAEKYKDSWAAQLLPKLKQTVSKQGYVVLAGAIALGICVWAYLYASMGTLSSPKDAELAVISPRLVAALEVDRAALAKADIVKAVGFIIASMAVLYLYAKKTFTIEIAAVMVTLLAIVDMNMVNSDYLNESKYIDQNFAIRADAQPMQKSDIQILKDKSIYKVVDYSMSYPSQSASASKLHKSMGGYSAAKPLLYQEFWNYYQMDNANVALQKHSHLMNMLNVKYIMLPQQRLMDNPTALGNAWFVEKVNVVKNADEELAALATLNPTLEAVVRADYADYVQGLNIEYTAGDKIHLSSYHPDTMIYQSQSSKDRFAVFSEMYYPKGWNVYIDGQKVESFIQTNYVLRGLKIPAGKHEIKMIYEPASVLVGYQVSLVTSLIILALVLLAFYRFFSQKEA